MSARRRRGKRRHVLMRPILWWPKLSEEYLEKSVRSARSETWFGSRIKVKNL
jgi:hypothetical protein